MFILCFVGDPLKDPLRFVKDLLRFVKDLLRFVKDPLRFVKDLLRFVRFFLQSRTLSSLLYAIHDGRVK